jgi:hypothetical protein
MKKLMAGMVMVILTSTVCLAEIFFWEDKNEIHSTDDVSTLPPKFRDNYEKYKKQNPKQETKEEVIVKAFPESAKNAVRALKKMEARCSSGLTVGNYNSALGDATFEVNMFVQSKESNDFESLKSSVIKTEQFYKQASNYFAEKKVKLEIARIIGTNVEQIEINDKYAGLASEAIDNASKELAIAFAMLNQ